MTLGSLPWGPPDHVHVADVDALVQTAVDPRQVLVDLQDHDVRLVQRCTGGGGGGGKVEVAVLVHGVTHIMATFTVKNWV